MASDFARCLRAPRAPCRRRRLGSDHPRSVAVGGRLRGALLGAVRALVHAALRHRSGRGSRAFSRRRSGMVRRDRVALHRAVRSVDAAGIRGPQRGAARRRRSEAAGTVGLRQRDPVACARASRDRGAARVPPIDDVSDCCGNSGWGTTRCSPCSSTRSTRRSRQARAVELPPLPDRVRRGEVLHRPRAVGHACTPRTAAPPDRAHRP